MALRIRQNGQILCAALSQQQPNDIYIDDGLHYELSVIRKILVTTPFHIHKQSNGEWWFKNQVPNNITIDKFYDHS